MVNSNMEDHKHHTNESIFEPIQNLLDLNKKLIDKYEIKRVIIVGDFNRNIESQIKLEPSRYKLKINSIKYKFYPIVNSSNKTCCSLSGWGYKTNYDQLIDTYSHPVLIHQLNKEPWYIPKSSDHLAILSVVKNYVE